MGKVAISADSVSLTPEKAREYGFTMIPLPIIMDGKQCLDTEINMDELYARLDTKENLPKTSTANVEEFLRFFAELSQKAEAIFHICMSSVFSPQYNNALRAVIGHTRVPDRAEKLNGKGLIDYTFSTRA